MDELVAYLLEKVEGINPNNSRANTGAVLLRMYPDLDKDIKKFLALSIQIMQGKFTKNTKDSPSGTAKLTTTSLAIGKSISELIYEQDLTWKKHIRLGDLIIEAFTMCEYITIARDGEGISAPYVIYVLDKWSKISELPEGLISDILIGSTDEIKKVTTLTQADNKPIIKGWESEDTEVFKNFLEDPFIKAADVLQSTNWEINTRVLNAILQNQDKFLEEQQEVPKEGSPSKVDAAYKALKKKDTPDNRQAYRDAADEWNIKKSALSTNSKNAEFKMTMLKAQLLSKLDNFVQYVTFDYRGRTYYSEPFLNFQGNDAARGLLKFHNKVLMTPAGERWLAIHTATSYNQSYTIEELQDIDWFTTDYVSHLSLLGMDSISVDKMTLEDREMWTWKNLNFILDVAREGSIMDCEKPVVFLACAIELLDWIRADDTFYTSLPVPVDGQCNGWQHLAAISKDEAAGDLVGLTDIEIPKDFYIVTAMEVYRLTNDPEVKAILKSMPMKHIRKGIAKRGSMVRAYSAGVNRIAENMYFDCCAEGYDKLYGIDMITCSKLAKTLVEAINNVCAGPMETMGFLQEVAQYEIGTKAQYNKATGELADYKSIKRLRNAKNDLVKEINKNNRRHGPLTRGESRNLIKLDRVSKRLNKYERRLMKGNGAEVLTWVTPSGFPVWYEADYTRTERCKGTIKTPEKSYRINHIAQIKTAVPDPVSFGKGVAPNYIHSMDGAHMALVINKYGKDFGAVHDSFSVHASNVDEVLGLIKETFIEMYHKDTCFEDITDNILANQDGFDTIPPSLGILNIGEVNDSNYFFS